MKARLAKLGCLLMLCCSPCGCTLDQYARMLIERDTTYGKVTEAMRGPAEHLVKRKTISAARRYRMPDGVEIDVWVVAAKPGTPARGTVLVLHDLGASKVSYLPLAGMLSAKGFDVVLPDLRAHGRSTGLYVTYGALGKHDQKRVIDALLSDGVVAEPLYVFGTGLGGSVAILYAAVEPRVCGVMAVAPSRDARAMCRRFLDRNAIRPDDRRLDEILARAGQIARFKPSEASAIDAVAELRCPILLVHSRQDESVPHTDSEALFAAARGPKKLDLVPSLCHVGVVFGREADIVRGVEELASGRLRPAPRPQRQAGSPPPPPHRRQGRTE